MSCHFPSSFASLRSLTGHIPVVLRVLLLALLSASPASQMHSLCHGPAGLPATVAPAPSTDPSTTPHAALVGLFDGTPSPRGTTAGECLQLRLLACFLACYKDRSATLTTVVGHSQRFLPGAEVYPGTMLLTVHYDYVVLCDQGYEERLYFPETEGVEATHATL